MKEKTILIYGGKSVEHDISIITAMQVLRFLPKSVDILPVYMDRNGIWWTAENLTDLTIYSNFSKLACKQKQVTFVLGEKILLEKKNHKFVPKCKIKQVLNCCHGNIGEDGSLQGVLKVCDISSNSSSVTSCALCMDKSFAKDVLKANDIPSAEYVYFRRCAFEHESTKILKKIEREISFPLVVKPSCLGSSIGISVCHKMEELLSAIELAFEFDDKVLVEKMVQNLKEFNCACFAFKKHLFVSNVFEVTNKKEIFSFDDKYLSTSQKSKQAEHGLAKKIQVLTEKIYTLFDCTGVVRVDFLFDEKEKTLLVNEINSIPGALAFYLFKDVKFKDLLLSILEQAEIDVNEKEKLVTTFDSDALKIFDDIAQSIKK